MGEENEGFNMSLHYLRFIGYKITLDSETISSSINKTLKKSQTSKLYTEIPTITTEQKKHLEQVKNAGMELSLDEKYELVKWFFVHKFFKSTSVKDNHESLGGGPIRSNLHRPKEKSGTAFIQYAV